MVFNLQLAFQGIPKPQSKTETFVHQIASTVRASLSLTLQSFATSYALLLIDTVRIGTEGAEVLTSGCKSANDVIFFMNGEEEKKPKAKPAPSPKKVQGHVVGSKVLRGKTRGEARNEVDESAQARMKEHQKELHQGRQDRGMERFAAEGEKEEGAGKKVHKKFESYKREEQLPKEIARRRVCPPSLSTPSSRTVPRRSWTLASTRSTSTSLVRPLSSPSTASRRPSTSTPSRA